jgi:hypothetical protein
MKRKHTSAFVLVGAALMLISTAAKGQSVYQPGVSFPMIGIANGESLRVNALNMGTSMSTPSSSCSVTLRFLDAQGQPLKQNVVTLRPGKAVSLDLNRKAVPSNNHRIEIRAVLLFGYSAGAAPARELLQQYDCNIVPSLEIYSNDTGKTNAVVTEAKPLPPSTTPPL